MIGKVNFKVAAPTRPPLCHWDCGERSGCGISFPASFTSDPAAVTCRRCQRRLAKSVALRREKAIPPSEILDAHRETLRLALAQIQADEAKAVWKEQGRLLGLWTALNGVLEYLCELSAALPDGEEP